MSKGKVDSLVRLVAITDAIAVAALVILAIALPGSRTVLLIGAAALVVGATVGLVALRRAMYRDLDDPSLR